MKVFGMSTAIGALIGVAVYIIVGVALLPTIISSTNATNVPGASVTELALLGLIGVMFTITLVIAPISAMGWA